jgi:predicted transcriptional regulator
MTNGSATVVILSPDAWRVAGEKSMAFSDDGVALRDAAKNLMLAFMQSQSACQPDGKGIRQTSIMRNCNLAWGDYGDSALGWQLTWCVGALRTLEQERKIWRDNSGFWRLAKGRLSDAPPEFFALKGEEIRTRARKRVLAFMRAKTICHPGQRGIRQKTIFHACGFNWGNFAGTDSNMQQNWVAELLQQLMKEGVVERTDKMWRLVTLDETPALHRPQRLAQSIS